MRFLLLHRSNGRETGINQGPYDGCPVIDYPAVAVVGLCEGAGAGVGAGVAFADRGGTIVLLNPVIE